MCMKATVQERCCVMKLPNIACRLSGLTYLKIHEATVEETSALLPSDPPWNLRESDICFTNHANTEWMNALLQKLVHVTYLRLEQWQHWLYETPRNIHWGSLTGLRYALQLN